MLDPNKVVNSKMPKNYYNYFDICKWEDIPTGTAKSALEKGVESISKIDKLKPIAHQFKVFAKYENGTLRNQYGILKSNYDFYKAKGRPRRQASGRPPKWKGKDLANINFRLPKELHNKFKEIVNNANKLTVSTISYQDMYIIAIKEFVERRPQFLNNDEDE